MVLPIGQYTGSVRLARSFLGKPSDGPKGEGPIRRWW